LTLAPNFGGNSGRIGCDLGAVGSDCGKTHGEMADPGEFRRLSSQVCIWWCGCGGSQPALFAGVSCSNSNVDSSAHGDNTGSNLVEDASEIRTLDILDIRFPANLPQGYAEWRSLSAARLPAHRFLEYRPEVPMKLSAATKGIP
jgi:hypothetical protein